jgi:hypothetical protein
MAEDRSDKRTKSGERRGTDRRQAATTGYSGPERRAGDRRNGDRRIAT